MNLEFLFLVGDYFKVLTRRDFYLEWLTPGLIGISAFFLGRRVQDISELAKNVTTNAIGLLGVLIGFSIAIITLLTTSSSANIEDLKRAETHYKIGTKRLYLFDVLVINYSYSVVVEILLVIGNLMLICALPSTKNNGFINAINAADAFLICHVLLLTLRNISNFYFVLLRDRKDEPEVF